MDSLAIASRMANSALHAQSTRMRVTSENLANYESTGATPGSDPYNRKVVHFDRAGGNRNEATVRVRSIDHDAKPFRLELRPGHPAANEAGYVKMPNVDPLIEVADLKDANRAYQANMQTMRQVRELVSMTIDLLKG